MGRRMRSIHNSFGKVLKRGWKKRKIVRKLKENVSRFKN